MNLNPTALDYANLYAEYTALLLLYRSLQKENDELKCTMRELTLHISREANSMRERIDSTHQRIGADVLVGSRQTHPAPAGDEDPVGHG